MNCDTPVLLDARRRFARRQVDDLLSEAAAELRAAQAGELVAVHGVFLAASRAVQIVMAEHLDVVA